MDEKKALEEFRKNRRINILVTLVDGKWKWKDGGKLGCNDAWVSSMSSRLVDAEAARDYIQRACSSSWWEWLAGSRQFFWS